MRALITVVVASYLKTRKLKACGRTFDFQGVNCVEPHKASGRSYGACMHEYASAILLRSCYLDIYIITTAKLRNNVSNIFNNNQPLYCILILVKCSSER